MGYKFIEELTFENGTIYKGYLLNDMRHGTGVQVFPDKAKYKGEWRENKANGYGVYIHFNGSR